jgi:hypothetical protein
MTLGRFFNSSRVSSEAVKVAKPLPEEPAPLVTSGLEEGEDDTDSKAIDLLLSELALEEEEEAEVS